MAQFRPPAVPLVTHTPYFSVWSQADRLTDVHTTHWTGAHNGMAGLIRIDGEAFRWCGPSPWSVPAMEQVSLEITATRSIYVFLAAGVELTVEFLSPLLADEIELLTRPVTYVSMSARSVDGAEHTVETYLDVNGQWCTDRPHQPVFAFRNRIEGLVSLGIRSQDQPVLRRVGDDLRIEWGTMYLASGDAEQSAIGFHEEAREAFVAAGELPKSDDTRFPRPVHDLWPALALAWNFGSVGSSSVTRRALLAYDEELAIEYFGRRLQAFWKKDGATISELLPTAWLEFESVSSRASAYDARLLTELGAAGGEALAKLGSLANRQCLAGHGIVQDFDGTLLMFSKENYSNGCIGTVDVTYPAAPYFLHLNPALLRAQIEPILDYSATPRWRFDFAPHDLGTYPKANGQVYGGGERTEVDQMPVEECGNMLVLVAAYSAWSGDDSLAIKHAATLEKWAHYLRIHGLDPEHQLCTDDFAGHLAHNVNLAAKAIMGLAAYEKLAQRLGLESTVPSVYEALDTYERAWEGDHYRLTFDSEGSWSQKYNMVWDRLLGLGVFNSERIEAEVGYYLSKNTANGLPLDNRQDYTKLDWIYWTASLTTDPEKRKALIDPTLDWANTTPSRVPMTDWYHTSDGRRAGFTARTVVGGLWMPLLSHENVKAD
jgi:Domain of unknown function (DUF4965)/Domain of unknown function (DUF5127)/Domain of unknown function (DUF1793)/Domain of unknown function (DUF4964)